MSEQDTIQRLVTEALDNFDSPGVTVASLVRKAIRVASLRRDFVALYSLQFETVDFTTERPISATSLSPTWKNIETLLGPDAARQALRDIVAQGTHVRMMQGSDKQHGASIDQLEGNLAKLEQVYSESVVPNNLASADAYHVARGVDNTKGRLIPMLHDHRAVIARIKQKVYDYFVATETELQSGDTVPNVFARGLDYVRTSLAERSPRALEMFTAAESRLEAGDIEALSQALTSVRRMIKELADVLYPPTGETIIGEDKIERVMDDAAYRNRLIQYVKDELGKRGQGEVVQEMLRSFGMRLGKLDSLANKGVHDGVALAEAESCIAWTFMLAADLLRIADGTSPAFTDE